MRILYFSRDYTPHDHRFLRSLAATEHEVFFLRLERRSITQEGRSLPPEVQVIEWEGGQQPACMRDGLKYLWGLHRVLRQVKPDVVHAGPLHNAAFLAAWSGFHPLVSMSWAYDLLFEANANRLNRWAVDYTLRHSDVLLCDNPSIAQLALVRGFPRERIVIFPWGIDLLKFSPNLDSGLRASLGWGDKFVLLHLRGWEKIYGVDVLANAFVLAAQEQPELRLLMLGGGSLEAEVRRIFDQGSVPERVHFAGQVRQDDLPPYYRAADLYISASHSDGSSVSLMEAMGSALPSLVSDIPGNRYWVEDGVQGWLFQDGNVEDLVRGILNAYEQRHKLAEMGKASRDLAEERADWKVNFKQLLAAYELALSDK
jgi:glycosyltransferase involved in cell wall biosynthesis